MEDADWRGIAPGGKGGRLGAESPAVPPPASGAGPGARLWSGARGARGEGAGGGRRQRRSVLFARASSTLWIRRPAGAAGGVPRGPVRRPLPGAGSTREPDSPGGSKGGDPGAEEDRRPPPKHAEGLRQEPPRSLGERQSPRNCFFGGKRVSGSNSSPPARTESPAKVTGMGAPPPQRPPPPSQLQISRRPPASRAGCPGRRRPAGRRVWVSVAGTGPRRGDCGSHLRRHLLSAPALHPRGSHPASWLCGGVGGRSTGGGGAPLAPGVAGGSP